ncbi:OmpH family outer membrane protein [Kaarinaea lacus]
MKSQFQGYIVAILLAGLYLLSTGVQAAELKIGFVNAPKVLEEAPQAEAAQQALQKEFSPRDKAIVDGQKEIRKLEDKLARDGVIMSESERRKLERDIVSRKRDLKREQEEFREDLNIRRNEAFEKIRNIVRDAINAIAKSEKYDLIVGEGVIYADNRIDITDKVIARLKQNFNKGGKK